MLLLPFLPFLGGATAAVVIRDNSTVPSSSTSATSPSVIIYPAGTDGEGVVINGQSNAIVDNYYGIPFAAPPVGDLRFTAPQDPTWTTRDFNATTPPPACLQSTDPRYSGYGTSEDCLYLNVQVPKGANAQTAFLPVMVWVYGGSFVAGTSTYYDGTAIVAQSAQSDQPVIYVSINYRLGALGFLNGAESAANGAANLGLRDVQKSLEWVQQNIWAWGGDPSRVTVFGQSAGSILISLLYLQPNISLFSGAIMESGAQSTSPIGPTSQLWQEPYDLLVQFAGCANSTAASNSTSASSNTTSSNGSSFECLKSLPAEQILMAQEQVRNISIYALPFIFSPSEDGDLIPGSPHDLLANGSFAKIPFITGNVRDEGTLFLPASLPYSNLTYIAGALSTIEPTGLPVDVLLQLFTTVYSMDPAAGSPFDTGNATFGLAPAYKEAAAILGDAAFQAPRRWWVEQAQAFGMCEQTWDYQWNAALPGAAPRLGVFHGTDVFYVFGLPIVKQMASSNPIDLPAGTQVSLNAYNFTAADAQLSQQVLQYWTNFAYYGNPNGDGSASGNATYWPPYNGSEINMLNFARGNVSVGKDDYRQTQMEFFLQRPTTFNYKRSDE